MAGEAVLVGGVPLTAVTSLVLTEGYRTANVAGSRIVQLVAPTAKTVAIEALLVGGDRAKRPLLEGLALVSRGLASVASVVTQVAGVSVAAKSGLHTDMQITGLTFTQDNQMRDTLRVSITLTHVPRSAAGGLLGGAADAALAAGSAFV